MRHPILERPEADEALIHYLRCDRLVQLLMQADVLAAMLLAPDGDARLETLLQEAQQLQSDGFRALCNVIEAMAARDLAAALQMQAELLLTLTENEGRDR